MRDEEVNPWLDATLVRNWARAQGKAMDRRRLRQRQEMMQRTRRFALDIIRLSSTLPRSMVSQVLGRQVLGSGTSVGAHYREACRAKSGPDFISKIEGALQELDETIYWLELLYEVYEEKRESARQLMAEADELISIFVSVVRKVKSPS